MKSNPSRRRTAKKAAAKSKESEDGGIVKETSRLQRKQTKQIKFLTKLRDGQRALSASKTLQKKKRKRTREKAAKVLDSIASLEESLPSKEQMLEISGAAVRRLPRKSAHQEAVMKETKQLASVLAHPQFQVNPFLAIQKHLMNTLPVEEVPAQKKSGEKKRSKPPKKGSSMEE
jgi:hypothetical protein